MVLDAILARQPFDADAVARLCQGNNARAAISDAVLKAALACLQGLGADNDQEADRNWDYLTKRLLTLRDKEKQLIWNLPVPAKVNWAGMIKSDVNAAIEEYFRNRGQSAAVGTVSRCTP